MARLGDVGFVRGYYLRKIQQFFVICLQLVIYRLYSLQGIGQLYGTIQTVKKYCNPPLKVMGILLTRYTGRVIISREVAEMIEETAHQLDTRLYNTRIRECAAIKESQAVRESIFAYAPKSNATADYSALIDELLNG